MAVRQIVYLVACVVLGDVQDKAFAGINYCFLKLSKSHSVGSSVWEHLA